MWGVGVDGQHVRVLILKSPTVFTLASSGKGMCLPRGKTEELELMYHLGSDSSHQPTRCLEGRRVGIGEPPEGGDSCCGTEFVHLGQADTLS